ncbi:MAG: AarF/ABC1/UbiB kinase family protein [Gammaproteobacteria bacterium]|nr:MAG: AarF/ABC1/UbiB kinase family protein [Gammaproteobacteria bacterium]
MNIFQFIGLLRQIYGSKKPDLQSIQQKGLLAMKIAQHYALRIDFLDEAVCRELSKLFRGTDSLPPDNVEKLLQENCQPGWVNNFSRFDTKAFASASIGQVHRGTLLDEQKVVIKIIRQNNREQFLKDLNNLESFLHFVLKIYPKLKRVFNPLDVLEYIKEYTLTELDLNNEIQGRNQLAEIKQKYQDLYDLSLLRLPEYFPEISNSNVLVSELIEGKTFEELLTNGELQYETLLDFFKIHGFYLFAAGSFHGDIHPGNIILDNNNQIVLIDNGAISSVAKSTRLGLFNFFEALSQYDYDESANCLHAMSHSQISDSRFSQFHSEFGDLYSDFKQSTVSKVSLTKKMMQTIKLGVHNGMTFGDDMFGIIKGLMYLDGMTLRCNPGANLMHDIRPFTSTLKPVIDQIEAT